MIKTGEREDKRSVEVVSSRPVFLPLLPLLTIIGKDIKRLVLLVPLGEVNFVIAQIRYLEYVF
jgi:hypothetical protein